MPACWPLRWRLTPLGHSPSTGEHRRHRVGRRELASSSRLHGLPHTPATHTVAVARTLAVLQWRGPLIARRPCIRPRAAQYTQMTWCGREADGCPGLLIYRQRSTPSQRSLRHQQSSRPSQAAVWACPPSRQRRQRRGPRRTRRTLWLARARRCASTSVWPSSATPPTDL